MNNQQKLPIGIFDSGIGGLTVARAINQLLPKEQLIYFGDTAHMPYGDRSAEHIRHYSERIADFLYEKGIKILVIACNSASANAYELLKKKFEGRIDVIGVISPVVRYITAHPFAKVGIIGTKATIASRQHQKRIKKASPGMQVVSMATPLLAPMIEEGFFNDRISKTVIESYLAAPKFKKVDALVLACTHYPLIKHEIQTYYKQQVEIIDTTEIVARAVYDSLRAQGLLASKKKEKDLFFVSEYTDSFANTTRLFYGERVDIHEVSLWNEKI
mgnify:CR=1 FL=1